jgi:hypothetical protein
MAQDAFDRGWEIEALMNWGERAFVAVCSIVVLAMIGTVSLAGGIAGALFVGVLMWAMLTMLAGPEEYQRRQ